MKTNGLQILSSSEKIVGDVFYLLPSKQNDPFFEMVTSERSLFHKKRFSEHFPPLGFSGHRISHWTSFRRKVLGWREFSVDFLCGDNFSLLAKIKGLIDLFVKYHANSHNICVCVEVSCVDMIRRSY